MFSGMTGCVESFWARVTDGIVNQRAPVDDAETRRTARAQRPEVTVTGVASSAVPPSVMLIATDRIAFKQLKNIKIYKKSIESIKSIKSIQSIKSIKPKFHHQFNGIHFDTATAGSKKNNLNAK